MQVSMLYTFLRRLYQNAISISIVHIGWYNAKHIIGIVHVLYEVQQDLPNCVQSLRGHPYGNLSQKAVQNPTAVVLKCRLRQFSP